MDMHRGGIGEARYAYAPGRSSAVFCLGRMGLWNGDRDCEPAQLIAAARMGELGREAPPRTERRNPASAFRGGVLLLDTQLPVAERGLRCRWPTFCAVNRGLLEGGEKLPRPPGL